MANELKSTATAMGALVERHLPRLLSLVPQQAKTLDPKLKPLAESALREADSALRAASSDDFRRELTACLALAAPTGMAQEDRNEWLRAAWGTLQGIPADLLRRGCDLARRTCDHPSKIVPAIMREIDPIWKRRKLDRSDVLSALAKMTTPEIAPEDRCTPEEARDIMRQFGIIPDEPVADRAKRGPAQAPTREWYISQGVSEEELDRIEAEKVKAA